MASWSDVLAKINSAESPVDSARREAIKGLSDYRDRNVICYYSGWLQNSSQSAEVSIEAIVGMLCDHRSSAMHNRHFSHDDLSDKGLKIKMMEEDNELQDRILTLHHAYMVSFQKTQAVKIIESSSGRRRILSVARP